MSQRLFFSVCILLAATALDGKNLHKQYKIARDDIPLSSQSYAPPGACESDRVRCPTSDRCIPQRWFCDGDNDCGDDSDETGDCPPVTCSEGQTKCPTKNRCKPTAYFCDGEDDCGDNSDEPEECRLRTCAEGQLKCDSGQCINTSGFCTGVESCRDKTPFTDVTCPRITCDPGYVQCPRKSKCIRSSYICDGDNDCGDMTDEPDNCRDRSCEPGEFRCDNGQCLNRTALCTSIETYGCKDSTDTDLCKGFTCPTGYTTCISDGKCTANSNLCDGSRDCADGSDESREHCDRPMECTGSDQAPCPSVRRCINTRYFCDTDNDCRDNSDEEESFCRTRTCQPTEVRCRNGQCIDKDGFCSETYACRDGSFSDRSEICPIPDFTLTLSPLEPDHPPSQQNSEPQMPSPEEMSCFMALMQARHTCGESPFPELTISPSNERAIYDKLVEIDLQELCGLMQTWYGCYKSSFSACDNVNNPMLADVKQMMSIGDVAINYVCVQEIEVFSSNKACLLKEADTGSNGYSPEIALTQALATSCVHAILLARDPGRSPWCLSDELRSCAKDAVEAQCGDTIANAMSGLADLVQAAAGCPTTRARSLPYSQDKRRAVRQLGSGDEEEMQCMIALISVRETCGENPFEGSSFGSSNPRVVYNQLAGGDLRQLCSIVQPWYECIQQAFSSCANVNNPMIDEPKRILNVAGTALNYVCVQHVDVINRHKACLLREASAGSHGLYPTPVIAQTAQASCSRHFQPGNGDPMCMPDAPLKACVKNVVAAQCGDEIANILSGLSDSIHAAAGCPARRVVKKSLLTTLKKRGGFPFHKRA